MDGIRIKTLREKPEDQFTYYLSYMNIFFR